MFSFTEQIAFVLKALFFREGCFYSISCIVTCKFVDDFFIHSFVVESKVNIMVLVTYLLALFMTVIGLKVELVL